MKWYAEPEMKPYGKRKVTQALIITFLGNLILAIIKSFAAQYSGSVGLKADAFNSISDVLYSVTLVLGLAIASRPADLSHPQGHERFEPLTGLVISLSMGVAGYEAIKESILKFRHPTLPRLGGTSLMVLLLSVGIKFLMYFSVRGIALKIDNAALRTAAKDNLVDCLTSAAALLGLLLAQKVSPIADAAAGLLVALWIFKSAFEALHENLGFLTGRGLPQDALDELRRLVLAVPGVVDVHRLFAEYVGPRLVLDTHINVDGEKTLNEVHLIESEVERILLEYTGSARIYVHSEPVGVD